MIHRAKSGPAISTFMQLLLCRDVAAVTRLIAIYAGAKWGKAGAIEKIVLKNWRLA